MLKTYLYIPEGLNQKINLTAKTQNKSKAEIIRQALEKGIIQVGQQATSSAQLLLKLTEMGHQHALKGPKDSSPKIDELLWDKDWSVSENE